MSRVLSIIVLLSAVVTLPGCAAGMAVASNAVLAASITQVFLTPGDETLLANQTTHQTDGYKKFHRDYVECQVIGEKQTTWLRPHSSSHVPFTQRCLESRGYETVGTKFVDGKWAWQ